MTHDDQGIGVLVIQIWKNLPFQTLILTAVLANIPRELEAAARNRPAEFIEIDRVRNEPDHVWVDAELLELAALRVRDGKHARRIRDHPSPEDHVKQPFAHAAP